MKVKSFFVSTLFAMLLMIGTAPLMVSCDPTEDPIDNPDNPNNPDNPDDPHNPDDPDTPTGNYVQYNGQTYTVSMLMSYEEDGMYAMSLVFGGGDYALSFAAMGEIEDGTYQVMDSYAALATGGIFGMLSLDGDPVFVAGTLTVSHTGQIYTVSFTGSSVNANYVGPLVDLSSETGEGTMTYGDLTQDVNYGAIYTDTANNVTYQVIQLSGDNADVAFVTLGTFSAGEYTIVMADDPENLQPNTVICSISMEDPSSGELVDIYLVSGRLQVSISGDTYTIHAYGTTESGISCSVDYTGSLSVIAFKK